MLSPRTIILALAASALSTAASPSLSLKVAGPAKVDTIENLKVTTTLTNTGEDTLDILKDPRGVLSERPANKFSIVNAKGTRPYFTGIKVKYVPEVAAKTGAYTTLTPGQSIEVIHDLANAYNFTASGVDTYDFEADNLFYIIQEDGSVSPLYANVDATHKTHVSGKLAANRAPRHSNLAKRHSFVGCSSSQQSAINAAESAAETYAANAYSYISSTTTGTARYTTWFGSYLASRRSTVLSHVSAINSNTFSTFTYDCTCTESGTYAYVYPSNFGYIYFCGAFWHAPTTGTDSKAGTIIHESSHFTKNGGTNDYVYGQSAAKRLALSNPSRAVMNADSHEYFAENNPTLS